MEMTVRWLSIFLCQVTLANLVGWYFPSERCLTLRRHGESRHRRGIFLKEYLEWDTMNIDNIDDIHIFLYLYIIIYMGYLWDLFNDCWWSWWFINGEELEWLAWYNWKNSIPDIKHPHKPWFGRGSDNIGDHTKWGCLVCQRPIPGWYKQVIFTSWFPGFLTFLTPDLGILTFFATHVTPYLGGIIAPLFGFFAPSLDDLVCP